MLSFLFIFNKNTVSASYLNGNSYTDMCTRYVKVIKPIRVYKVRTGTCEAKNKFHKYGKIKQRCENLDFSLSYEYRRWLGSYKRTQILLN